MSDFSRAYQKQITGQEGMAWVQNGVKFVGMKDGVLLDAKASEGAKIQWYFAEEEARDVVQDLFMNKGITEIEFIFQEPK